MKTFLLLLLLPFAAGAQDSTRQTAGQMKQYFFVMLSKGANRSHDSATAAKIQEGHMANLTRLAKAGKIVVAGPFGDDGNWRGIFNFDCATKEEVESLVKTDRRSSQGDLRMKFIHGGR